MFQVNVLGLIRLCREVGGDEKKGRGHIINIASQAGKTATPKSAVYAGTKFAVRGYSNALRLELKQYGISVTTVNPGPIRTDFFAKADPDGSYLAKLGRWVLDPGRAAELIVESMLTNRREINLPWPMELGARFYVLFRGWGFLDPYSLQLQVNKTTGRRGDVPYIEAGIELNAPLKWAGGKRWLLPHLEPLWVRAASPRLVEPFCGGLAVALGLRAERALLNDVNTHLINFYRWLQRDWWCACPW